MNYLSSANLFGSSESSKNAATAARLHRENERNNLLTFTRLVLRSFLEKVMKDSRNRTLEGDTQEASDLLMMLEKVLNHGFKPPSQKVLFGFGSPDGDLWLCITRLAKSSETMTETVSCVDQLTDLQSSITKIRAFLRISLMQKRLSEFFTHITQHVLLRDFYEQWALLRHDDAVQLAGALLGLSVVDAHLNIKNDHLQDQPLSVDLSSYVRIPSISTEELCNESAPFSNDERKILLDQNNYLEERIKFLENSLTGYKRKVHEYEHKNHVNNDVIKMDVEMVSFRNIDDKKSHQQEPKESFDEERQRFMGQIVEREDSLRIVEQQLKDTKALNIDLYDKLRLAEDTVRQLERDFLRQREHSIQEYDNLKSTINRLEAENTLLHDRVATKSSTDDAVRVEFHKKCDQFAKILAVLEEKQKELGRVKLSSEPDNDARVENEKKSLKHEVEFMRAAMADLPEIRGELERMKLEYSDSLKKNADTEKALEELGGQVSESKLRVISLTEELLPLTEAQWAKDSEIHNCSSCNEKFTLARRKHHCRMCGSILCASCSEGRVTLPSNPKPSRVCDKCYQVLRTRHTTK